VGPATETIAPNIPGVVKGGTPVKVLKEGFKSTEGPMGLPDGSLLFTTGDLIYRIDLSGNSSIYLENTKGANGLGYDPKGRLIAAQEHGIGVLLPKGSETTLTDNFDGKPFLRPNDVTVDRRGGVYFTDFIFTPPGKPYVPKPGSLPPAVYYHPPGGKTIKVDEYRRPNGIILSPDEKTLYVNSDDPYMFAYDVMPDGKLGPRRNFGKYANIPADQTPRGDGLAVDTEGRIYAVTTGGVQVFNPKGENIGVIVFSRVPQNLAFGGPDNKTLYVVGRGVVFTVQMLATGFGRGTRGK
jgi:gluconolactonase